MSNLCAFRALGFFVKAAGGVVLLVVGCAVAHYDRVRDRWTREATDLHKFDTALDVTATYRSREFREALAEREIAWFFLEGKEAQAVRDREAAEDATSNEFFLAVRTHSDTWNDFDAENPSWRIVLIDEQGRTLAPVAIEAVRNVTPVLREFFPYTDTFARAYRVRFPKQASDGSVFIGSATRWVALRIAGPLGSTQLRWNLK